VNSPLNVLLIDNYDSFTFNLVDELRKQGAHVHVWRNDLPPAVALAQALALPPPRLIVLSPGPGKPEDAGCCQGLVALAQDQVPIFGVCLGLQAIVQALGGRVGKAGEVVHGKAVAIEHNGSDIFSSLPSPLLVGRYHSLVAQEGPPELEVTARAKGLVMAVAHRQKPIIAVQFHPESILTPQGSLMLQHLIAWAGTRRENAPALTQEAPHA
jgi:anthranilate synthase/aminodeoxychorismate synthase-like glutamine amidotransferase